VANIWKGVLNNGKSGFFNPAYTVAYLGSNLPSNKTEFIRGGMYKWKRQSLSVSGACASKHADRMNDFETLRQTMCYFKQ